MIKIGLIKEGKIPADNRVALTPAQCKWIHKNLDSVQIIVQSFINTLFQRQGIFHGRRRSKG